MEGIDSSLYAPEIQRSTVSLAWHFPDVALPVILRHLDPHVHFPEPFCADLLTAINMVFSELNMADFPTVLDCLSQQNKRYSPEQKAALSEIYALAEHQTRATRDLIDYYIELLKDYALLRGPLSPTQKPPILRFSGGTALLKDNFYKKRSGSLDPDFIGPGQIEGKRYQISLWIEKDVFDKTVVQLRFKPSQAQGL